MKAVYIFCTTLLILAIASSLFLILGPLGLFIAIPIAGGLFWIGNTLVQQKRLSRRYKEVGPKEVLFRYLYFGLFLISFLFAFHAIYMHINWDVVQGKASTYVEAGKVLKQAYDEEVQTQIDQRATQARDLAERLDGNLTVTGDSTKAKLERLVGEGTIEYTDDVLPQVEERLTDMETLTRAKYQLATETQMRQPNYYDNLINKAENAFSIPWNVIYGSFVFQDIAPMYEKLLSDIGEHFPEITEQMANNNSQEEVIFGAPWQTLLNADFIPKTLSLLAVLALVAGALLEYLLLKRNSETGSYPPRPKQNISNLVFSIFSIVLLVIVLFI